MKYEVNFGGLDFSKGITINEIYVGNDTNKINTSNKPTFKTLEELATICYIYGITIVEPPTPVIRNLFIFNSKADLVDNVSDSTKFMNVTCDGVAYDISPDGNKPVASVKGVASVNVTAAGDNYTEPPTVTPDSGDATFKAYLKTISAAVQAGGSGYTVGDTITLANGVVLTVATLSTDAVATATVTTPGSFDSAPDDNPIAQTATSGSGTGATFNLTYGVEKVEVVEAGDYEVAPTLSFDGDGSGAAATATLADAPTVDYVSNIIVKEASIMSDATLMQFVMGGNVVFDGKKDDNIDDIDSLIGWLDDNYGAFGTYADVSSGNIKAISVTGTRNFPSANYVRFRG